MIETVLNNRFFLERELGRGGMGIVYRAQDQSLQRPVAIKALKNVSGPELARKILLEAQITARLLHEHIVTLYDIGESDGMSYLVMELVDGTSFHHRIKKLPLLEKLRVVMETSEALDYAHRQGVIHRDIKPGNILLTANDRAKLSDFGLSIREEEVRETKTIKGTPLYMSPEQAQGRKVTHRTDLYALGIILYECVAGVTPFTGPLMAVMTQHISAEPEPLRNRTPNVPSALEKLVHSLLAKEPEKRPATGKAVADALRQILQPVPAPAASASRNDRVNSSSPTVSIPADALLPALTPGSSSKTEAPTSFGDESGGINGDPKPSSKTKTKSGDSRAASGKPKFDSRHPLIRTMIEPIDVIPLAISPKQRFLAGHYLAYLMGGSPRKGILGFRPLDRRNADRARLMLAMIHIMMNRGSEDSIQRAAELLDSQPDPRAAIHPTTVIKYLLCRKTAALRSRFRELREELKEKSAYAAEHMIDAQGVLNPGLMPQSLTDLWQLAPAGEVIDDKTVERWNRLAKTWKGDPKFRQAILKYATRDTANDPAVLELWPEVVYPLLERARWQRQRRSPIEAVREVLGGRVLLIPQAGLTFDKTVKRQVPAEILDDMDQALDAFQDDPEADADYLDDDQLEADGDARDDVNVPLDEDEIVDAPPPRRLAADRRVVESLVVEEGNGDLPHDIMPLLSKVPFRFTMGEVRELYNESVKADPRQSVSVSSSIGLAPVSISAPQQGHFKTIGSYRLVAIPSYRGRSAGQAAILGGQKRIDMLIPSIKLSSESSSRPVIAVWLYKDNSLVIAYLDHKNSPQYAFYHTGTGVLERADDLGVFHHSLLGAKLEVPDQLAEVLTKKYRMPKS